MNLAPIKALLEQKAKAVAAAIVTAVVAYASTAIAHSTVITAHGLEAAAVGAVLAFVGVHQAPANKVKVKPGARGTSAGSVTLSVIADTSAFRAEIQRLAADLAKVGNHPAVKPAPKPRHSTRPAK